MISPVSFPFFNELALRSRAIATSQTSSKEGIEEILNLQSKQGKAKTYQVKQVRDVIVKYQLGGQDED